MLGAMAIVMAAAGATAATLGFRGDFVELLPEGSDEVEDLHFVEKRAGGSGYLIVQVAGGTIDERRAYADALAPELEKEKELVRYVEHKFDVAFFEKRALLLFDAAKLEGLEDDLRARIDFEKAKANPLLADLDEDPPLTFEEIEKKYTSGAPRSAYIESQDASELYLYVKPTKPPADLDFNRALVAKVKEIGERTRARWPMLSLGYTGSFVLRIEEDDVMQRDLSRAALLSALVALGIIVLATRRAVALFVVGLPVALGITLTFAYARLDVGHLNPITGMLAAVLIGLGLEYGVHLSMRYWEERAAVDPIHAMQHAVQGTFYGALTSASTNAAAFLVLIFADFVAFRQFGRIAAIGVLITLLCAYILVPALMFVGERMRPFRPVGHPGEELITRDWLPPRYVLASVVVIITVAGAWSVAVFDRVSFETDLRKLKGESPAADLDEHVTKQLGIVMSPAIVHVPDVASAENVAEIARDVKAKTGTLTTSIDRVASVADLLPKTSPRHEEVMESLKEMVRKLPKQEERSATEKKLDDFAALVEAKPWGPDELPAEIQRRFRALEGAGTFLLVFPRYMGYDTAELQLWAADLDAILRRAREAGIDAHLLDGNRIAARIFALIAKDGPFILSGAAIAVFLMIWISLRSLIRAVKVAVPLFMGMLCVFGGMVLFGVKLNFLNIVVLPNLLAIAVDNSVHIFHRYEEEGPGSIPHVMRHTGVAALVATLTNVTGYASLLVAHHEGLRSIAVLALLGVACTFVGTTVLFPSVLQLLERRQAR